MSRKKNIDKKDIYSFYMKYYLENGEAPKNVYQMAQLYNFDESQFYTFFGNLKSIEKSIFKSFLEQTLDLLSKSEEYAGFDAKNQLLTFYYTFFEILTANRSYVMSILERDKNSTDFLKTLAAIRPGYIEFVRSLDFDKIEIKQEQIDKLLGKSQEESLWIQLVLCLKFWMEDDSPSLEKTDIFIEKSINTGFELLSIKPLKSVLDLGKFLFHEKINMN